MQRNIRLGQCYEASFSKRNLLVRLEDHHPRGGWVACILEHGRRIRVKSEEQLIRRCDEQGIGIVADETVPNRRSQRTTPPPARPIPEAPPLPVKTALTCRNFDQSLLQSPSGMSLLDAAAQVLKEVRKALTPREIVEKILEKNLWTPTGATPWATLNTALIREINTKKSMSRFAKHERGKYRLKK